MNGSYDGVYLLCEQNEVGKTRVDIEDDFAKALNPEDMGFLLEMDGNAPSESEFPYDYFSLNDSDYGDKTIEMSQIRNYAIKSPDVVDGENNWDIYYDYIKNYVHQCMLCISGTNYYKVVEMIDVNSFADSYILNELFNCKDVGQSSFYLYKKEWGKLYSGPIWDYDVSSGNCDFNDTFYQEKGSWEYDCLWAKELNIWYYYLLQHTEFQQLVSEKLKVYKNLIVDTINNAVESVFNFSNSFLRNFERWDILGQYVWPNSAEMVAISTWEGQVEYVQDWLLNSLDYLLSEYCRDESLPSESLGL